MKTEELGWAGNGTLRSRDHLAVIEPYQTHALCGVGIAAIREIRPRTSVNVCPKCIRAARKLGIEWYEVGIENNLVGEVAAMREP